MLFIQEEHIGTFAKDFYEKNKNYGVSKNGLRISNDKVAFIAEKFASAYAKYDKIINESAYDRIVDYIGSENAYFNA